MEEIPVLKEEDVLQRLRGRAAKKGAAERLLAFYSSEYGGVVTEPHLFSVAVDDHLVHRGHAVFDTAMVLYGKLYQLQQHVDRILISARKVRIDLERGGLTREKIVSAVRAVARAAGKDMQALRFWIGAGRGDFSISPKETLGATFYCVSTAWTDMEPTLYERGIKVVTSTIPIKPSMFANAKTTNYLPNVLLVMEAEDQSGWQGVWTDSHGDVAELGTANVAFIMQATPNTLTVPPFEGTLAGISVQRVMHIAQKYLGMQVEQRPVALQEAKFDSAEAFAFGGPYLTLPITRWDDDLINGGSVGHISKSLREAQLRDWKDAWGESGHLEDI
eukprot:Plantae.Rhodophyta-Purpureofilum_apyrenoidigerum.ctg10321.p1 GENE.Plantae.Rhodophyta-Purpureofilum_apyrenoidigerum.ctg10321~~Plantae.Rhodophyta-Purpureofilum_apyrenoidigerum.ctg10321.p1  ORF type:complete len:341 (-),score=58.45 Plantae.Rhodophyta-Purpureofilum_apyrenoidigerum.ctg10321:209-1204(-)